MAQKSAQWDSCQHFLKCRVFTLSITKRDTYQFCTLACSFEREIEKAKGEQGSRKNKQIQETVPLFIFRVQTTHRCITDAEYCIPLKKTADHRPWKQTKLVQFTREICDAYRKEKDNELWRWRIFHQQIHDSMWGAGFFQLWFHSLWSHLKESLSGCSGNVFTPILLPSVCLHYGNEMHFHLVPNQRHVSLE